MKADRTDKLLFALMILGAIIATFAIFRWCNQHKANLTPTNPQITTIRETIRIHDTTILPIETIKTYYRNRFDTVSRWLYDSTWDNVCSIMGTFENKTTCQREVGRRLLAGQRDSQFVQLYRNQRQRDSTVIRGLKLIDTIQTERLKVCMTENSKIVKANAKETRRKRMYKAISVITIGLILIK